MRCFFRFLNIFFFFISDAASCTLYLWNVSLSRDLHILPKPPTPPLMFPPNNLLWSIAASPSGSEVVFRKHLEASLYISYTSLFPVMYHTHLFLAYTIPIILRHCQSSSYVRTCGKTRWRRERKMWKTFTRFVSIFHFLKAERLGAPAV